MIPRKCLTAAAALIAMPIAALMGGLSSTASALPLSAGAAEIASAAGSQTLTTQVQVRRRAAPPRIVGRPGFVGPRYRPYYRPFVRRGPVVINPFLYSSFPYYDPYEYDPYYYYGAPPYLGVAPYFGPPGDGAIAYCVRRFRSYDIRTRTYLGYDGRRHPCP